MDLREIPEINEMCEKIKKVQGDWDGMCSCKDCYWNLWHPTMGKGRYNSEDSKICVSEDLTDTKMTPNDSSECVGYYSYKEACGHNKE